MVIVLTNGPIRFETTAVVVCAIMHRWQIFVGLNEAHRECVRAQDHGGKVVDQKCVNVKKNDNHERSEVGRKKLIEKTLI
jgi:hypothetical protein